MVENENILISMTGITKEFPGVKALNNVSLNIKKGEVLALVGENGAGKSTLIKILSGIYQTDSGGITIHGKPISICDPKMAHKIGISTIFQEPSLAPDLTAVQNIYLGRELIGKGLHNLDEKKMINETAKLYSKFFPTIEDINVPVRELGALKNRVIEIVKALSIDSSLVIMDEPTAALEESEKQVLFDIVHQLKSHGISVLYITHHLKELFGLVDRISVLRDGENVTELNPNITSVDELVSFMVGRPISKYIVKEKIKIGETILAANKLNIKGVIKDISLYVRKGEIVGLAGLAGAGRTETVRAIFGADRIDSGSVEVNGKIKKILSPKDAINAGIGMLAENRKTQGALIDLSVMENITLANFKGVLNARFIINKNREAGCAREYIKKLGVKTPSMQQKMKFLSGGNQQKAILAKWLFAKPKVLIFDEPTQGIDVGAKQEIYKLIADFVRNDGGIILVSSDLPELLGLADRIYVMHQGCILKEYSREDATEENIMLFASGGSV